MACLASFTRGTCRRRGCARTLSCFAGMTGGCGDSPHTVSTLSHVTSVRRGSGSFNGLIPILTRVRGHLNNSGHPMRTLCAAHFHETGTLEGTTFRTVRNRGTAGRIRITGTGGVLGTTIGTCSRLVASLIGPPASTRMSSHRGRRGTLIHRTSVFNGTTVCSHCPRASRTGGGRGHTRTVGTFRVTIGSCPGNRSTPGTLVRVNSLCAVVGRIRGTRTTLSRLHGSCPSSSRTGDTLPLVTSGLVGLNVHRRTATHCERVFTSSDTSCSSCSVLHTIGTLVSSGRCSLTTVNVSGVMSGRSSPVTSRTEFTRYGLIVTRGGCPLTISGLITFAGSFPHVSLTLRTARLVDRSTSVTNLSRGSSTGHRRFFSATVLTVGSLRGHHAGSIRMTRYSVTINEVVVGGTITRRRFKSGGGTDSCHNGTLVSFVGFLRSNGSHGPRLLSLLRVSRPAEPGAV